MRRSSLAVIVLVLMLVLQGSGCDDTNNTTIISGEELIASLFPGTPISDNNIGNDGQSLSDAEVILNQGYVVFRNASNNTAILLHTDKAERLWAYFFDGMGFTPGVEIRGANQLDFDQDLGVLGGESDEDHVTWRSYQVLFLNTAGHANPNASARNGDAIVIWVKKDFAPPPGADPDADANFRLYGTYFDVSAAATPASGDVRFGFDTTAEPIDFDNQSPAGDDDVSVAGFVSDSLVLTHRFPQHQNSQFETFQEEMELEEPALSGDPTTFVHVVWRKALQDGVSMVQARYHQVAFDLAGSTNDIPSELSLGAGVLPVPSGVTIPDNTAVGLAEGGGPPQLIGGFVVHNGEMIWEAIATDGSVTNPLLFLTRFGAGAPATIELSDALSVKGQNANLPDKRNVYGGDHGGLLGLYVFFHVFVAGSPNLHLAKSDLDAPMSRETTDISFANNVDFAVGTKINRTADWILAAWIEDIADIDVLARAVQTRGAGDGPRTLANSLSAIVLPPNQSHFTVDYLTLQSEIADGTEDPSCGVQSDRNRINFAFQQMNLMDTSLEDLIHNGLIFTADTTGAAPPTAAAALTGVADGVVDQHDTDYPFLGDDMRPVVTDLGVPSGAPLLYYLRNDNNPTDSSVPGAFTEIRVFGKPGVSGGVATLIGTDGALVDNTINTTMFDSGEEPIDELTNGVPGHSNFLRVQTAQLNRNVNASPNHGGTLTHVFFEEARGGGNSLWALKTRAFQKTAFSEALPAGFGAAHLPPAPTSPPIALDGTLNSPPWVYPTFHQDNQDIGAIGNMFVVQGNTVGVFFQSDDDQGAHFWYQEFDGTSWYTDAGLGDAQQIDNKYGSNAFFGHDQMAYAFPGFSNSSCDNRAGTIALFVRNLAGDDPHVRRLFARVIN